MLNESFIAAMKKAISCHLQRPLHCYCNCMLILLNNNFTSAHLVMNILCDFFFKHDSLGIDEACGSGKIS